METENIGKKCKKSRGCRSPKPFKSGFQINTIKGLIKNPHTGKDAYTFKEDDSCVHCDQVIIEE